MKQHTIPLKLFIISIFILVWAIQSEGAVSLGVNKKISAVVSFENNDLFINKGTFEGVRPRDIYKITASNGDEKGLIEIKTVGESRSLVKFYFTKSTNTAAHVIEDGDLAKFAWHQYIFSLSPLIVLTQEKSHEQSQFRGGGLLLNFSFKTGNSLESLLGFMDHKIFPGEATWVKSRFLIPLWFRKTFCYQTECLLSPSISAGLSYTQTTLKFKYPRFGESSNYKKITPMLGFGLETAPLRRLHLRFDVQKYYPQKTEFEGNSYDTQNAFFLIGAGFKW